MRRCGRTCLFLLLLGTIAVALFTTKPSARAASTRSLCGSERWAVKTLADPYAHKVNFHPRKTTISFLRRLPPTHTYARAPGAERTTYRFRARLLETKVEDDGDIHLVVADPRHRSHTMIVELPSANCTHHSLKRKEMRRARTSFVRACGLPPSDEFARLKGTATIAGVGFFDYDHGQTGIAPNGIELHPVVAFSHAKC
jgi:hypothetical protein